MTAATLTITDFLLARIAEDEASVVDGSCECEGSDLTRLPSCPDRVLAECAAKRAIVEECRALINSFGDWDAEVGAPALWPDVRRRERSQAHGRLRTLAAVYSDHEDYNPEWRP